MSLLAELKRRNVIRMAGLYLVVAWLIVQVSSTILPMFSTPQWLPRAIVVLLAIGLLPTLVFAWVYELTPEGVKRDSELPREQPFAPATGRRMDRMIMVVLALGIAYFALDKFVLAPRLAAPHAASGAETPQAATAAAPVKSIAVLPFADLSAAHDQEYFSDGMAEELLNALVRVKGLKVAGRTSSFYYKGRNEDLRAVGKALGVANVLEGSVRKQGERVRITAQLVRSEDGFHLWSETYDGELKDVFELQERIARAITDKLAVILEGGADQRLVPVATTNPEAYALYLRATDVLNRRDYPRMGEAIGWLEQALKLDPGFARGEARLALLHVLGVGKFGAVPAEAERHARLALALDPNFAEPYYALSTWARYQRRFRESREWLDRAEALEPDDASVNLYYAQWLITVGYTRQGVERLDRTLAIDPMLPNALNWRAMQYSFAGDHEAAERMAKRAEALGLGLSASPLAEVARARGDLERAKALVLPGLLLNADCLKDPETSLRRLLDGTSAGADVPARDAATAVLEECVAAGPDQLPTWVVLSYLRLGQPERVLALIHARPTRDEAGTFFRIWSPIGVGLRRLPGFPGFMRDVGLAEVWDRYGPPDLCKRRGPGDYVCE